MLNLIIWSATTIITGGLTGLAANAFKTTAKEAAPVIVTQGINLLQAGGFSIGTTTLGISGYNWFFNKEDKFVTPFCQ